MANWQVGVNVEKGGQQHATWHDLLFLSSSIQKKQHQKQILQTLGGFFHSLSLLDELMEIYYKLLNALISPKGLFHFFLRVLPSFTNETNHNDD